MKKRTGMPMKAKILACLSTFCVVFAFCLIASPLANAFPSWTKHSGQLSLENEKFVADSWVVKSGATYEMWYTHGATSLSLTQIISQINSVITSDIVNDLAGFDLAALFGQHLPLTDIDALWTLLETSSTSIGYATSVDGIDWSIVDSQSLTANGPGWDSVSNPCVVKKAPNDYLMWYTHSWISLSKSELATALSDLGNPAERVNAFTTLLQCIGTSIDYATSTDGQTWSAGTPVITPTNHTSVLGEPSVIFDDSQFELWYSYAETNLTSTDIENIVSDIYAGTFTLDDLYGLRNSFSSTIRYATSADGQTWSASQNTTGISTLGAGFLYSAASPSVVKTGAGYEMWYTYPQTDLDAAAFRDMVDTLVSLKPDINNLWSSFASGDLDAFLEQLVLFLDGNPPADPLINPLKPFLANTNTLIGYATSNDGVSWTITDAHAITGSTDNLWSSVFAPAVIMNNGKYEMWFTRGLDDLSAQNVLDLLQGDILPIGYASFISSVDLNLVTGWNFIGLPLNPDPSTTPDVLASVINNVKTVWAYNAATGQWSYFTTIPGAPQGSLTNLAQGAGYWVEMTNPDTLTVNGAPPALPFNINMVTGWNLVALPKTPSPSTTPDVLAGIISNVKTVWTYDAATGQWSYFTTIPGAPQGSLTNMTAGKAYWIEMTAPATLVIN